MKVLEIQKLYGDLIAVCVNGSGNMTSHAHSGWFYDDVLIPAVKRVRVLEEPCRAEPGRYYGYEHNCNSDNNGTSAVTIVTIVTIVISVTIIVIIVIIVIIAIIVIVIIVIIVIICITVIIVTH